MPQVKPYIKGSVFYRDYIDSLRDWVNLDPDESEPKGKEAISEM